MAVSRQKKEEILKELIEKFEKAQSVAFGQYAGLSVTDMQEMRSDMREQGVEFKVAKKTLFKLAAQHHGMELPDDILEGTVGAAFSYEDMVSGPKVLKATSKKHEVVQLLGGVMEGQVLTTSEMKELADLPSRDALLAKFVGMMQAPLYGFRGAISAPLSSFSRALDAYAEKAGDQAEA